MGIYDGFKDVLDVVRKMDDVELYRKIVDLQLEVVELTRKLQTIEDQKKELEQKLQFAKKLTFKEPFYYAEGDDVPACSRCWENDKKFIHLTDAHGNREYFNCPQCKQGFKARRGTSTATLPLDLPNLGAY